MKHKIKHRITGGTIITTIIDCEECTPIEVKTGLAAKWAIENGVSLCRADLRNAKLDGLDLSAAIMLGADLSGANLDRADLSGVTMCEVNLFRAKLRGADLSNTDLFGSNLREADLFRAVMVGTTLRRTNLSRANLSNTNLVDGGQRSDGHRFVGWIKGGELHINAGDQDFKISEARAHSQLMQRDTALGGETAIILDHIEAAAKMRGLIS